jgi:hypothetical protein
MDNHRHSFPEILNSGAQTKDEQKLTKVSALVSQQSRMTCALKVTQSD